MTSNSIPITYKWKIDFEEQYKLTPEGVMYNSMTGRKIKKTVNGYSVGYWIAGKFYTCARLRQHLLRIKNIKSPF